MRLLAELLASLLRPYLDSPLWSSLVGTVVTLALTYLASLALYRLLQAIARRLSPGPVFVLGALVVVCVYFVLLLYLWAHGKSFEGGVVEWLAGQSGLPFDALGSYQAPMLLALFYVMMQAAYLLVVVVAAYALGFYSGGEPGGLARGIEEELGTSYGMRFYKLCGYHRVDAPEIRFHRWASEIGRALRWAKWLSLPGVLTGSVPAGLWVAGAVLLDGWQRNLAVPPVAQEEEAREDDEQAQATAAPRDPSFLVHALQADQRGPMLSIVGGGQIAGRNEHAAQKTRIAEESAVIADILRALGIDALYVHQEAAVEALFGGKDVLMETPPLSGRRTLCDVLAMRAVLLGGGTVLYLSPSRAESERRAQAFSRVARGSNWRWAIYHHDLARDAREGLDLKLRQPQIVFATPEELHVDMCRLHRDWDYFLGGLAMIVAIDLDRYMGPRGANLMFLVRRLARVAQAAGARPRVLATVAPFGPDVQGFAERLLGRPLTVIGPESDSRGAPAQYVVVAEAGAARSIHPAVGARGVAIACGYNAEIWGHREILTDFEQEQQVNKVLLQFDRAQVSQTEDGDLRFDEADAIVARLSSDKAAMIPFFTRHVGRKALGVAALAAQEVGRRRAATRDRPDAPFAGFQRFEDSADVGKEGRAAGEPAGAEGEGAAAADQAEPEIELHEDGEAAAQQDQVAEALTRAPEMAVALWLSDDDAFARHLARHAGYLHPQQIHPMLKLGSKLSASPDNAAITMHHLLCAVAETPVSRAEAARVFGAHALEALLDNGKEATEATAVTGSTGTRGNAKAGSLRERLVERPRLRLDDQGAVEQHFELMVEGGVWSGGGLASGVSSRGSMSVASLDTACLVNRSGGEVILETDACRILAVAYPGRVLQRGGRRYRVLLGEEQQRIDEGVVWAEPERRRVVTTRLRRLDLRFDGEGHELSLGGAPVRFHHTKVRLDETVIGVRQTQEARGHHDTLHYEEPVKTGYATRAAILQLDPGAPEAFEALERLARVTLPAFVRHGEEDLDVYADAPAGRLFFVDRHPGGTGFARAVTTDVLRHVLYWSRALVTECPGPGCPRSDGCPQCVGGAPSLAATMHRASRNGAHALLETVLG